MKGSVILLSALFFLYACSGVQDKASVTRPDMPPKPEPESYVCYKAGSLLKIDGRIDEKSWNDVPWTTYFQDIEGPAKTEPRFRTRAKMMWDSAWLYVAAELEEPHVWATLKQRDAVIYHDNDFEIFIDPDHDTHAYYEFEFNVFATEWDLLLIKPYRDGGPAVDGWDVPGLEVAVHVDGTLNDPSDTDTGWSIEIAIPLQALRECNRGRLPAPGDRWRINFSRVEWRTIAENGRYEKETDPQTGRPYPEDNWVWSPQGRINMHMPEMWGYLQFSDITAGEGREEFVPDPAFEEKWALRSIYYAERVFFKKQGRYTTDPGEAGLSPDDFPEELGDPVIHITRTTFESWFEGAAAEGWTIYHDGKIIRTGKRE